MLLTTLLGLGVLVVTVRAALLADVARAANADVEQEIEEFQEFVSVGRDPETADPFTSTDALLDVFLSRQRPARGEVLLGYVRGSDEVIYARQTDPGAPDPYEVDRDSALLNRLVSSTALAGVTDTPGGEMRWGRVDVATDQPGDAGGSLIVTVFTERGAERVDDTTRTIMGVGAGVLILVGGIAWLVAGQILRPVRTVRQAAAQITERDLTRRIPVQGTDDVAALASTFNGMLDRLEEAFATQRRFVDDAAHELRTPITIVYGHLELLPDDPLERRLSIDLVLDELSRMGRIVADLLLLANAERPDFVVLDEVDAAALTLDIDAKVQVLANRRWTLTQVADGVVRVDAGRVTQAVLQLAQNAVQHTTDGSEIQISSSFREEDDEVLLELTVRDLGPGVRPAETTHIFDRFTHGSASRGASARPGAGLGLAIVRAIAEGHGGSAFVSSTPGRGATFGICIPARPVDAPGATGVVRAGGSGRTTPAPGPAAAGATATHAHRTEDAR